MARRILKAAAAARAAVAWALAALSGPALTGCMSPPVIEVEAPLMVFNTYPANGARVQAEDLLELSVAFSTDLGAEEPARAMLAAHLVVRGPDGARLSWVQPEATNLAYDATRYTARVLLDGPLRAALSPGLHTVTLDRDLATTEGWALPNDFVLRFVVEKPEGEELGEDAGEEALDEEALGEAGQDGG